MPQLPNDSPVIMKTPAIDFQTSVLVRKCTASPILQEKALHAMGQGEEDHAHTGDTVIDRNRKGYFSMVLQALVDHKGHFTNINVGWPGKVHDTHVFRIAGLFQQLQQGTYFPDQKITFGDVEMPIVILGDPAYPLMPWLMKPYTGTLDSSQELFNYRLSKCRMVVECAFGHLKARWHSLLSRLDLSETNIPIIITACCALYNICESKGETFMAGWEVEANLLAAGFAQPDTRVVRRAQEGVVRIREALKTSFMTGQATV
ncbi:hypothetical protein UY3_12939 [Chelonia mydas]|uniref:DDE Tnp4 domain-containing protein n=1 Tax=Chelonia mydas TaxID=8469 RepID=M7BP45_CHEMY|nr:hypothetical protein UY3_12939 [Chelonia mydas]